MLQVFDRFSEFSSTYKECVEAFAIDYLSKILLTTKEYNSPHKNTHIKDRMLQYTILDDGKGYGKTYVIPIAYSYDFKEKVRVFLDSLGVLCPK